MTPAHHKAPAVVLGIDPLRSMVALIAAAGQETRLHIHTEWLSLMSEPTLPERRGFNMCAFSQDEQVLLIQTALANLHACAAPRPTAFRAGNYGANAATLRALARNGIFIDTSYNPCYLGAVRDLPLPDSMMSPQIVVGVLELPVTVFQDWPGHLRHAQLGACSFGELKSMLLQAHDRDWRAFVIVSHSFELMSQSRRRGDPVVVRRFERLRRFLADNPDRFRTRGFADLSPEELVGPRCGSPLRSNPMRTAWRIGEQLSRRVYG
jgi:hypothetical protein